MEIVDASVRPCSQPLRDANWKFARAAVASLDAHVLVLTDDAGNTGLGYTHAVPAVSTHGAGARAGLEWVLPMVKGRRLEEIGTIIDEIDAKIAFQVSVKAAVDMALHDLLARRLGVPMHLLLGGSMRASVPQSRILPLKIPAAMSEHATTLFTEGYRSFKIKLSGDTPLDVQRVAAVRAAVGTEAVLTLDPNQAYNAKQMMGAFAKMERYDIALIEQPVPAADWEGLALLTRTLPVAIEADESAGSVAEVFRLVTDRVVDSINLKVTKLGGLRRFSQALKICEAGGVVCRLGAAFGPALLQAASVHAASTIKSLPYACELAEHQHLLDDPFTSLPVERGDIAVPTVPGCGVDYV